MALITCPECGRENVSDTAIACPGCGYAIREHFERIKDEKEQYNKNIKETELQEYQQRIEAEEKQRIIESRRIDAVKKINNDIDRCKTNMALFSFFLVFLIGLMIYTKFSVMVILYVACDLFIVFRNKSKLDESKKLLQLSESNIEQFDKKIEAERLKTEAIEESTQRIKERKRQIEEAQHPVCPNCGSKNTHRISTARKIVSTEALGLASSTIGKQYKCDDCKHMW